MSPTYNIEIIVFLSGASVFPSAKGGNFYPNDITDREILG
jgi:hypothetical protein